MLFYLPFDTDVLARTPETEVLPSGGIDYVDDMDLNVTMGEIALGPKLMAVQGEEVAAEGDDRVRLVPGLRGKAARLTTAITYPAPWLKEMPAGTITR